MNAPITTLEQSLLKIKSLENEITYLKEQLAWFHKNLFGKRSEKIVEPDCKVPTFFDLMGLPEEENVKKVEVQQIPQHVRKIQKEEKSTKIAFPENLPIERIVLDLNEDEKICPETKKPLIKIGEEVTQKLAKKPEAYFIKEIIRPKYASPKGSEESISIAPLPESLLNRCKADESFLADILVKKFADHLPLFRQSEILARQNINVSKQILSKWVIKSALALKPIYEEMKDQILKSKNIFVDEVPVDMLKQGKGKVSQAYMWVLVGGQNSNPAFRIYDFRTDRTHKNAEELLKNYRDGVLHSDKYGAYETLANKKWFTWCPCWVHIRRKFIEGHAGDPDFVNMILRKIKYLFMFERIGWKYSEEKRLWIRQEKEIPIIDELIALIKDRFYNGKILPRSKFKEALGYFVGLIPYLKNYTLHANSRIDNNVAERAVRPLVIGRKNWLFLGSEEGGEAAAIALSLVQTCRALKINPQEYLEDVMRRIMSHSAKKISELLPGNWVKA